MTVNKPDRDLTGKVALVTGASGGIGRRFATVLAANGAKVALCGRRQQALDETLETVRQVGGDGIAIQCDLTRAEDILEMVNAAEAGLGAVTILVNNAGIPDAKRAIRMDIELVDRVIGTNLRAPFILSTEIAKRLIAAKQPGRIVNVASASAYHYDGNGAALYSTTKSAIIRMTEALAVEWAKFNINVTAIAPGMIETEMMAGMIARMGNLAEVTPRGRICAPEALDSTLLFLVSPASYAVTGTTVRVDDGQFPR